MVLGLGAIRCQCKNVLQEIKSKLPTRYSIV